MVSDTATHAVPRMYVYTTVLFRKYRKICYNFINRLVCGSIKGQFEQLYNRVTKYEAQQGPFDLLLCVGTLFSNELSELKRLLNNEFIVSYYTLYNCKLQYIYTLLLTVSISNILYIRQRTFRSIRTIRI